MARRLVGLGGTEGGGRIARAAAPGRKFISQVGRAMEIDLGDAASIGTVVTPVGVGGVVASTNDLVSTITLYAGDLKSWAVPAVEDEWPGTDYYRAVANFAGYLSARLVANIQAAGPAGAYLSVEFGGFTLSWARLLGDIGIDISTASILLTGWKAMPAAALSDGVIRLIGGGGDGATTVDFGNIYLQLRRSSGSSATVDEMAI